MYTLNTNFYLSSHQFSQVVSLLNLGFQLMKAFYSLICTICYCFPADNYMLKVNNGNTRTKCEICSKLTIKTAERRRHISSIAIVNFEQANAGWVFETQSYVLSSLHFFQLIICSENCKLYTGLLNLHHFSELNQLKLMFPCQCTNFLARIWFQCH